MAQTLEARLNPYVPQALSLYRIVFGFLFAVYGANKLFAWPVDAGRGALPVGAWPVWWAGLIELVAGLLIMVGLFTRTAAFVGSGAMAVAYFWQHQPDALLPHANDGIDAVMLCFAFLLLVFTGPGAYAFDSLRRRRSPARASV
jgi:putative oxidoreductase